MEEIMSQAEHYIKGEERNTEKKARDIKERGQSGDKKGYYPPPTRDRGTFKIGDRRPEGHR